MQFAEVAVDFPGSGRRTFTYSVPADIDVRPGHAVWVPFGNRIRRGIVFALADQTEFDETRPLERLLNPVRLFSENRLALARWVAEYYRSGLFTAASQMLPPGFADSLRTYVSLAENALNPENLGVRELRALQLVRDQSTIRRDRLARKLGRGGANVVDRLVRRDWLTQETRWERPRTKATYRNYVQLAVSPSEAIEVADDQRSDRRGDLLRLLADTPDGESRPALAGRFGRSAVDGLVKVGLLRVESRATARDPLRGLKFQQTFPLDPTEPQTFAIDRLKSAINGSGGRFLLYGVTGSGKTEVYLQAAQAALDVGKGVLVLVPEIALTPQNLERFAGRFAGNIALLHSGLSEGERFDQWWAVHQGKYRIALGSRGAVFAPMDDVGLIILDEEHEWTYKQHDAAPRYHARSVAEKLCQITGATLLAGSATPDVETFRRSELGEYERLVLPARVGGVAYSSAETTDRASVTVVDMRNELREGNAQLFSRVLQSAMGDSLGAGDRVILFLNRRGAASHVQCRNCGYVRRCNRCDTALTYHRGGAPDVPDNLVCHYCSQRIRYTNLCPGCSERRLLPSGSGTQSVVDEVTRLFPRSGVLRWDRDVARTARAHSEILANFLAGGNQVLVGTQMVAKGLDIPSVGLVGVVSADTGLSIPDFRAGERAFQILTQVAGRAGRGTDQGRAIIQTFQPHHYAVENAAAQDFEAFYETELDLRRRYANPPFTGLIRLGYSDPESDVVRREALTLASSLRYQAEVAGGTPSEVIGPAPSFPTRVRGRTRWHIIIKGSQPGLLLDRIDLPAGWTVDIDPISVS